MKKMILTMLLFLFAVVAAPLAPQASLADGKYSLPYQVNTSGSNNASYGNDYFLKPATLYIKNGQMYVQLTIKNSMWINTFNGSEGGNSVLSRNEAADTRVVQFNISNPSGTTKATMKVDIDELSYHHEYGVDFVWYGNQASLIESYAAPVKEEAKPVETKPATQAPAAQTQTKPATQTQTPAQTPAQTQTKPATETKQPVETKATTEAKATTETKVEEKAKTEGQEKAEDKKEEVKTEETTEENEADVAVAEVTKVEDVEEAKQEKTEEKVNEVTEAAIEVTDTKDSSSNAMFGLIVIAVALLGSVGYIVYRKKSKVA